MTLISDLPDGRSGFLAPRAMTPTDLGDHLARLVWESFSDFIADGEAEALLRELGLDGEEGFPDQRIVEEILIFFMWSHTRAVQLAFAGRAEEGLLRAALDAMHRAIFEDMVANGTPRAQLPLFEQRVSARYAEYHAAAARSDAEVGLAALRHLAEPADGEDPDRLAWGLTQRALVVAHPLRDFLGDVELEG